MIVIGLTGSIGMGKTTTAAAFAAQGVPIYSADDAVHALYAGRAAASVEALFPGTVREGVVDRNALGARVLNDPQALGRLEALVHPMVREEETAFLDGHEHAGTPIVLVDIPLLFEKGFEGRVDRIVVVSAPPEIQRERVLARPGMTAEKFASILAKQMPDAEKRARADFVVDTSQSKDAAAAQVAAILAQLRA